MAGNLLRAARACAFVSDSLAGEIFAYRTRVQVNDGSGVDTYIFVMIERENWALSVQLFT